MTECGHLIGGDPARPCAARVGHRDRGHRDAAQVARRREWQERNRERLLEQRREHYRQNRERLLEQGRERYQENRERRLAYAKRNRARTHATQIRRRYGLESHEYAVIKKAQGGKCAICGIATGRSKRLAVDHCHKTREVRGILCSRCNAFLGTIRDNPEAGERLAEYLRNPPAPRALGRVVLVPEDSPAQQPRKRKPRAPRKTG